MRYVIDIFSKNGNDITKIRRWLIKPSKCRRNTFDIKKIWSGEASGATCSRLYRNLDKGDILRQIEQIRQNAWVIAVNDQLSNYMIYEDKIGKIGEENG